MGADFVFAITKACTNPDQAKQNINDLPFPILAEIAEALWGDYPEPEDGEVLQNVRDILIRSI